ncbi:hypothetical protein AUJ95_07990 [Candidatus Desantisbacteria bacterium CG2_30_40_21]|uniref:Uncharacterized protein n=4 Tax=unclassified Candidatus Desantisiibacteriota TaxID=3106372 RepID=A0A2M7J8X0_9BACT|nr:MAG: hypothetical protein AUJ95_07990 [Candidatus Desantisbacteria bacterium CG2_30_40_21]PIX15811.1 MAG: hypothetical protein COZ71_09405 [Candidatus Desantisbacteria bacterium CG_4_8_14_3_um_filter_40_12]PIY19714.1 MAG: hypothetical protein COZ13_03930 [Candidatus Desantisbacteria bacterium CG_4_10_14_3_um_filter_40_18]PJB29800.1 MAG: hypothetical protein CO110_03885 [Candidatus Desantisbacteria bacterium CG_4_9_14_3_um_filter_40_11]
MNAVVGIEAELSNLGTVDLHHLECVIHKLYRKRNDRVIYDDTYGLWMTEDQTSAASEVFALFDEQEEQNVSC